MADDHHRISAAALRSRGLATTSGRGASWAATLTKAGEEYLARVDGPTPPIPRQPNVSVTEQLVGTVQISIGQRGWTVEIDYLSKTSILLAPHHGREAGVCSKAFDLMNPKLCIISDGPTSETSSNVYSVLASGAQVRQGGSNITRRALSTRKDAEALVVGKVPAGKLLTVAVVENELASPFGTRPAFGGRRCVAAPDALSLG